MPIITAQALPDEGEGAFLRVYKIDGALYEAWDEPLNGWTKIIDLVNGRTYFRHTDGTEYTED